MNAIHITDYGTPAPMHLTDVPVPQAAAGELLIATRAIGINPLDLKLASGAMRQMMPLHFPWTPGLDVAGVVDADGDGVTGFKVGDEVYGMVAGGAYAEKVAAPAALFAHKPGALKRTLARRPDLLASAPLSPQDSAALLTLGATPDDLRAWGAPPAPPPKKVKRRKKPDDTPSGT